MNFFDLWWGALIFFGFLVVEIWAAVDKHPGGTLSELVWKIYIHPKRNAHYTRFIFGGFWAALTLHLFFMVTVTPVIIFGTVMVLPILWHYERRGI